MSKIKSSRPIKNNSTRVAVKKDFSKSFNFAQQQKSEQELRDLQDEIKKKGNRLIITKCYGDVRAYKNLIQEYLQSVLDHMYSVKKDISFWQTQYYITVETIDAKLEELTQQLLQEEKEKIQIAGTVDEIAGLIVDLYK
ncbi:YaaR family protein [Clostridium pasteurianum]|uniref:YaaR family protein n=1 Tax=Clostridium pasteurianum TaxID=1501 RepID=UPI003D6E351E